MKANELLPLLRLHGRTVFDEEKNALFFNWTCGGFTVRFRGRTLRARLSALSDQIPPLPGMPQPPPDFCLSNTSVSMVSDMIVRGVKG